MTSQCLLLRRPPPLSRKHPQRRLRRRNPLLPARGAFRSLPGRARAITRLAPARDWEGPEFRGLETTRLRPVRAWHGQVLTKVTVPAARALVRPDLVVRAEQKAAHALHSNSVPAAPVVVVLEALVAPAVPGDLVDLVAVAPEAVVAPEADAVAALEGEPLAPLVAVAKRASLVSRSGRSAKNLR